VSQRVESETSKLATWEEVESSADWTGLLVGNGSSIVVWKDFAYGSLFDVAEQQIAHPLEFSDRELFDAFGTTNFEQILASLKTARVVNTALELETTLLTERYRSVQRALFEAVHAVHVPWSRVSAGTIPALHKILRRYKHVYTTNYDLLLYWASMEKGGAGFLDFLWRKDDLAFDIRDTKIWLSREGWTRLLYLHGGIHLRRVAGGGTRKVSTAGGTILDQFSTSVESDDSPLLVSEADSSEKLRSIQSSDYLTFAHQEFAQHEGGLVIFGHGLGEGDSHIAAPVKRWNNPVAVSIRPADDATVIEAKARYRNRLAPLQNVLFFDATTHPLGDSGLAPRALKGMFRRR
jgi:hypothetical protein